MAPVIDSNPTGVIGILDMKPSAKQRLADYLKASQDMMGFSIV
jgi:hypothetical protein